MPDSMLARVLPEAEMVLAELTTHLADDRRGERLRAGLTVAVIGARTPASRALSTASHAATSRS